MDGAAWEELARAKWAQAGAPRRLAALRTLPDGTSAAADAADWLVTQFLGAFGIGPEPKALAETFLRVFASDAAPALCGAVAMESAVCASMTREAAAIGGEGAPRVARLCRLATALWMVLAPVAGGGGFSSADSEGAKAVARAAQPFRSAVFAQVTRRGRMERALGGLGEAFLAGADPVAGPASASSGDARHAADSRRLLATPLCGLLRALHQWPLGDPARPCESIWSIKGFAALRAAALCLASSSRDIHASTVVSTVRACLSPAMIAERGVEGALDIVSAASCVPLAVVLKLAAKTMAGAPATSDGSASATGAADPATDDAASIPPGAEEAATADAGSLPAPGRATVAVASLDAAKVEELAAAIAVPSCRLAGLACGQFLAEALASAVESLLVHPALACAAFEASPSAKAAVQSLLHLRLQERRGVSPATVLQLAARSAVALALGALPPALALLPDAAAAAAVTGPLAMLAPGTRLDAESSAPEGAAAATEGVPAAPAATSSPWSSSAGQAAAKDAAAEASRKLGSSLKAPLPGPEAAQWALAAARATPRCAPVTLPGGSTPLSTPVSDAEAAMRAGSMAAAWTSIADLLPVRDVVSLSRASKGLASLLMLHDGAPAVLAEHRPSLAVPRPAGAGGAATAATGEPLRVGRPGSVVPKSTFSVAASLCAREGVSAPPEVASPALASSPVVPSAPKPEPAVSPLARLYWSRRMARLLSAPLAASSDGAIAVLDDAVREWGAPVAGHAAGGDAASGAGGAGTSAAEEQPWLRPDLLRPPYPTPASTAAPDARDPVALFTAPARGCRTAAGGLLGAAGELGVRATDVVDACVAQMAAALMRSRSASSSEHEAVSRMLLAPMHDAAAALSAATWMGVAVAAHSSLVRDLYMRKRSMALDDGPAAEARGPAGAAVAPEPAQRAAPSRSDPLALLRALSLIAEQWTGRRLRGDRSRMPPAACGSGTSDPLFRAHVAAARALSARLLPALADTDAPVGQSHVLIPSEHQRLDGRLETGALGHPALAAALVRLLLVRGLPQGELSWTLTQATLGANVVPAVARLPPARRTQSALVAALRASVVADCAVLRRSGGQHFGSTAPPGQKHPMQTASAVYRLAASALAIAARSTMSASPEVGAALDEAVASLEGVTGPGGKPLQAVATQLALCLSNAAECELRLGNSAIAARMAMAALVVDGTNSKARSRLTRAMATM